MNSPASFHACVAYIDTQFTPSHPRINLTQYGRAVTLSRQTGCRAHRIGLQLANWLTDHDPDPGRPWTLFDKDLIDRVLAENQLPGKMARFMPEDRVPEIESLLGEILRLHPSLWELFEKTAATIVNLARAGRVILVGRGAHLLTAHLPLTTHVRLTGSLSRRVAQIVADRGLTVEDAEEAVDNEDRARARYLKAYFNKDISDASLYDLVLRTDFLTDEAAAEIIGRAALARIPE